MRLRRPVGRGTPRIANNLLRFVQDFRQQKSLPVADQTIAHDALAMLEIGRDGLDDMDNKILSIIGQNQG
jgi:Holliday junction DNA helicase RuvB